MKSRLLFIFILFLSVFASMQMKAQGIQSVSYLLKYNIDSCHYEVFAIINQGSATSRTERQAFNSSVSLVMAPTTNVTIKNIYNPVDSSGSGNIWSNGTTRTFNGVKYAYITTPLATNYYVGPRSNSNIIQGDTLKLFSLNISPIRNCATDLRLFNNLTDPEPAQTGNQNFRNGFTIGGTDQKYFESGSFPIHPRKPRIASITPACSNGIEINLTATGALKSDGTPNNCQGNLSYLWTYPNGTTSTSEDVAIVGASAADAGLFKVVVSDSMGCKDSITINAENKPNAGLDTTICSSHQLQLRGSNPPNGNWFQPTTPPLNSTLASFSSAGPGVQNVTFPSNANGTYRFIYKRTSSSICSDEVSVIVNRLPLVALDNPSICAFIDSTTTTVRSNPTGGTWVSNNPSVATINSASQVVTGVSQGSATFTYTNANGCRATTPALNVDGKPIIVIGDTTICLNDSTFINPPSNNGTWEGLNPLRLTIPNNGTLKGIGVGLDTFFWRNTNAPYCRSDNRIVEVRPLPNTMLNRDTICVGDTTLIVPIPLTVGTWMSNDVNVAGVTNDGLVNAKLVGQTTFKFTNAEGCTSPNSAPLTITAPPVINGFTNTLCSFISNADTLTLTPSTAGGTWTSSDVSKATINSAGIINTLNPGAVTFTYTEPGGCSVTSPILSVETSPEIVADPGGLCIGDIKTLSSSGINGTWDVTPSSSAFISFTTVPTPTATGLATGLGQVTFTVIKSDGSQGCKDTFDINVSPRPIIMLTGNDSVCIGSTTAFTPSTGGIWKSSNDATATINQTTGLVTGLTAGEATFTYQVIDGCTSDPSQPITVVAPATVAYRSVPFACLNDNTIRVDAFDLGTWRSNDPTIATVSSSGLITPVSAGVTYFIFTEASLGCETRLGPDNFTVYALPEVEINLDTICGTQNAQLTTNSGSGSWITSNSTIASVTANGIVTPGTATGTVTFTFSTLGTPTSPSCSNSVPLFVSPKPSINPLGDNMICVDETNTITASPAGGSWRSNKPSVATINQVTGVYKGIAQGQTTFIYTSPSGCESESATLQVDNPPTLNNPGKICVGLSTAPITSSSPGTWSSLDPSIATINPTTGVATGVKGGLVFLRFTSSITGCSSNTPTQLEVTNSDTTVLNTPSICVGTTALVTPPGAWISSDTSIATIQSNGQILGKKPGKASFNFTNLLTGCKAQSDSITITTGPAINNPADTLLCIGETTTITLNGSSATGVWSSENPSVASVDPTSGLITAIAPGFAKFKFTDNAGCQSQETTSALLVDPKPTITMPLNAPLDLCIGGTTEFDANISGTWVSLNPTVATINNAGTVSAVGTGTARFLFTSTAGCPGDTTVEIKIGLEPTVRIDGRKTICIGDTTTLFPSTGGTWTSSNPAIATVSNIGVVSSKAPGFVSFIFTATGGCTSNGTTDTLTVTNCLDPDINVTYVNVPVPGDVSTNDNIATGIAVSYGVVTIPASKPSQSNPTLILNSDGTYTFVADKVGVYVYNVPVCIDPITTGCPTTLLTITVIDYFDANKAPVANTDFGTTKKNTAITLISLANDACVITLGCTLNPAIAIVDAPNNGTAVIDPATGNVTYTPNANFLGRDTLRYQVCVTGEPTNCATALQIISVDDTTSTNSTVALDDFTTTPENTPVSGNVKINDSDPQGHIQTVVAQTGTTKAGGTLVLATDGSYTFTPAPLFFGPVEFEYETCDNGTPQACDKATLHILVVPDLGVKVRVYLEGALMQSTGTAPDGRPLMRDNLRKSPFTGQNYIPIKTFYKYPVANGNFAGALYNVTTSRAGGTAVKNRFKPRGTDTLLTKYDIIAPAVLAVTGPDAIVDWVFIELRDGATGTNIVATRSALLQRDGDVVDIDGFSTLKFPGAAVKNYHVVVKHRNHLSVMSKDSLTPKQLFTLVNFTKSEEIPSFDRGIITTPGGTYNYAGYGQKTGVKPLYKAMWAGDFNSDGQVKYTGNNLDLNILQNDVANQLLNPNSTLNYDFAINYFAGDYDMNSKAKFDNPNDDKNFIFAQVVNSVLNPSSLSQFDYIWEQMPETIFP